MLPDRAESDHHAEYPRAYRDIRKRAIAGLSAVRMLGEVLTELLRGVLTELLSESGSASREKLAGH